MHLFNVEWFKKLFSILFLGILDNATLVWTGGHSLYDNGWMWDNYQEPFNSTFWILGENTTRWKFIWIKYLTLKIWFRRLRIL